MKPVKPMTVVLQHPTPEWGEYIATVKAASVGDAVRKVRTEVFDAYARDHYEDPEYSEMPRRATDWAVIAVFNGHPKILAYSFDFLKETK